MLNNKRVSTPDSDPLAPGDLQRLLSSLPGLPFKNLLVHTESAEYGAATFSLEGKQLHYRVSKITPTKTGQFVTLWKRNANGETAPLDQADAFEGVIIAARSAGRLGFFVWSKRVLVEQGVVSVSGKGGKRGLRVYPPWDQVNSKQAQKTQDWQIRYFVRVEENNITPISHRIIELVRDQT